MKKILKDGFITANTNSISKDSWEWISNNRYSTISGLLTTTLIARTFGLRNDNLHDGFYARGFNLVSSPANKSTPKDKEVMNISTSMKKWLRNSPNTVNFLRRVATKLGATGDAYTFGGMMFSDSKEGIAIVEPMLALITYSILRPISDLKSDSPDFINTFDFAMNAARESGTQLKADGWHWNIPVDPTGATGVLQFIESVNTARSINPSPSNLIRPHESAWWSPGIAIAQLEVECCDQIKKNIPGINSTLDSFRKGFLTQEGLNGVELNRAFNQKWYGTEPQLIPTDYKYLIDSGFPHKGDPTLATNCANVIKILSGSTMSNPNVVNSLALGLGSGIIKIKNDVCENILGIFNQENCGVKDLIRIVSDYMMEFAPDGKSYGFHLQRVATYGSNLITDPGTIDVMSFKNSNEIDIKEVLFEADVETVANVIKESLQPGRQPDDSILLIPESLGMVLEITSSKG